MHKQLHPSRIIVERRHDERLAYYDDRPEAAFGGQTPTEAVYRLTGPNEADEMPETWRERPPMR